ncbi:MAG: hypothetical protein ACYCYK_03160 [Candidatus Dormibacteria bacterium]
MVAGVRRACGCLLLSATLGFALLLALVSYPYVGPQVPRLAHAVREGVSTLSADLRSVEAPRPAPPSSAVWHRPSLNDCHWASATLGADRSLDLEAAANYPAWAAWYQTTASWWAQAGQVVDGLCGMGREPTATSCTTAVTHLQEGMATHQAALNGTSPEGEPGTGPSAQAWNQTWVANYQRLLSVVTSSGCGVPG